MGSRTTVNDEDRYEALGMMSSAQSLNSGVTMEETPAGEIMPSWLFDALISRNRLMVLYPTEASRKISIKRLHNTGKSGLIDTTLHVTLKRLISTLHLDLRLPSVMEDDGILFERVHEGLKVASQDYRLSGLMSNPNAKWNRSKTRRLLSLYKEISSLKSPWNWEEDPGAKVCDDVLKEIGKKYNSTHPLRVEREVLKSLQEAKVSPFTISDIDGIIMLDHPTGISELSLELLSEISRFTGVHQLVNPGSHRLGYHGEFIHDIPSISSKSELPSWVPEHEVKKQSNPGDWQTPIGKGKNTSIHRIIVEKESHEVLALANLIPKLGANSVIISGDPDSLKSDLKIHLDHIGINISSSAKKLIESPSIAQLLEIMNIANGEEAWSLSRLTDINSQIGLPIDLSFNDLIHPQNEEWKPIFHAEVMAELARGFHLLGGKGTLSRWLFTLASASPRAGVNEEKRSRELEECQWWLLAFANWMQPLLPEYDREINTDCFIGCSTNTSLPVNESPSSVISWFNSTATKIKWDDLTRQDFSNSINIQSLQTLYSSITKFSLEGIEISIENIIDLVTSIAENTETATSRGSDSEIQVLNYSQAYGVQAETIILCGLDSTKWSMKSRPIPWLDDNQRMKLGLHKPDEPLRIGRHLLRHYLNCAKTVIIIDTTIEDGVEFSGPLDEWFNTLKQSGQIEELNRPPSIILSEEWHPNTQNRAWEWKTVDKENKLFFRVNSMEIIDNNVTTHRSGRLPRDSVQRAGLSVIENRSPHLMPNNYKGMLYAAENEILSDQIDRRIISPSLEEGEIFPFDEATNLVITSGLKLTPSRYTSANGRSSPVWPHLGLKGEKHTGLPIDPRPISPPSTQFSELDSILGRSSVEYDTPKSWSQSRLQSWLDCPRKAWYEKHMRVSREEDLREDLAAITRGDIVHQIEETILHAHGIEPNKISALSNPLNAGQIQNPENAWIIALNKLQEIAPWMKRVDGVAAHRCRDLVGVSPEEWNSFIEEEIQLSIGGRLGRMIIADFGLTNASPIAVEWQIKTNGKYTADISLPESETSVKVNGRIDRVDEIKLEYGGMDADFSDVIPLDFDISSPPKSKRLIVIRDIKSVDGTKDNGDEQRHLNSIFKELQLALYARAWEISNPGDRVIGVGVTTVGNDTIHRIELDPEFDEFVEHLSIGEITSHTHGHYRLPGSELESSSNPFRAWMRERITTATRVIEGIKKGNIHPEPSSENCKYCGIADACASSKRGDS